MRTSISILFLSLSLILAACSPLAPSRDTLQAAADPATAAGIQVGLVITSAEESSVANLVTLEAADATALDALRTSAADLVIAETSFGPAICAINGVGQPANDCFGDAEGRYWAFFFRNPAGEWEAAPVGVGSYPLEDGVVLGFAWTASDANYNPLLLPPAMTLAEIAGR